MRLGDVDEAFDAALIKLGAATRANLMRGARRAMARDFRITLNSDSATTATTGGGAAGGGGGGAGGGARGAARGMPLTATNTNGERL